ncbi:MAG: ComF family protein [Pseudomonadota bacterium]
MKSLLARIRSQHPLLQSIYRCWQQALPRVKNCVICHDRSPQSICAACEDYLTRNHHCCRRCGEPLSQQIRTTATCGRCLRQAPSIDKTFAPLIYQAPLNKLIHDFKQNRQLPIGQALGELMVDSLLQNHRHNHQTMPDYLVAVPLHWRQLWQRGFNQSAFLTQLISDYCGIPILKGLYRVRRASEQKHLTRQQRLQNLKHCFTLKRPLQGEHIAIVDDVMTTGATANTIAALLKKAGAGTVSVWVIARTPKPSSQAPDSPA